MIREVLALVLMGVMRMSMPSHRSRKCPGSGGVADVVDAEDTRIDVSPIREKLITSPHESELMRVRLG